MSSYRQHNARVGCAKRFDLLQKIALSAPTEIHQLWIHFDFGLVWSGLVWSFKRNSQCVESVAPDYAVQAKRVLMLGHEYLLHPSSLAKHVTAFFSAALTTDTFALNDTLSSLINDLIDR